MEESGNQVDQKDRLVGGIGAREEVNDGLEVFFGNGGGLIVGGEFGANGVESVKGHLEFNFNQIASFFEVFNELVEAGRRNEPQVVRVGGELDALHVVGAELDVYRGESVPKLGHLGLVQGPHLHRLTSKDVVVLPILVQLQLHGELGCLHRIRHQNGVREDQDR